MRLLILWVSFLSLNVPFAEADVPAREDAREAVRERIMSHSSSYFGPSIAPASNDNAENLVDQLFSKNLAEMESAKRMDAELPNAPWSDSYWPIYSGEIANRYADPNYRAGLNWMENRNYLISNLGRGPMEQMSAAEKYDLLVGDNAFTLTRKMISAGAPYADEKGNVETWMGLCHGWAPASFMVPRPSHTIRTKASDGREIVFYPSDLKALASLLWANAPVQTRFIGGRCNARKPNRDSNGRELEKDCMDTNPATWHIAVVNQIGWNKRSFVLDASAGFEVWNQPVFGYRYGYLQPVTRESGSKLADAKIRIKDFSQDPFKAHRSREAVYLVEVVMSVVYVSENNPMVSEKDDPDQDSRMAVTYHYDLELDERDNIVGGEWHSSVHPDFLWLPEKGARALSQGDQWLLSQNDSSEWDLRGPIPPLWKKAAKVSSSVEQPLARILESLLREANR